MYCTLVNIITTIHSSITNTYVYWNDCSKQFSSQRRLINIWYNQVPMIDHWPLRLSTNWFHEFRQNSLFYIVYIYRKMFMYYYVNSSVYFFIQRIFCPRILSKIKNDNNNNALFFILSLSPTLPTGHVWHSILEKKSLSYNNYYFSDKLVSLMVHFTIYTRASYLREHIRTLTRVSEACTNTHTSNTIIIYYIIIISYIISCIHIFIYYV